VYLTGDPQITFFKVVYRRYTNFAIESIQQTFNGTPDFNKKVSVTVSRNGDLINNVFLELTLTKSGATFYPAEAILSTVELEIGGQTVDKHYADWFRIYDELFRTGDEKAQHQALTDFVDGEASGTSKTFFVPLIFFFNRNVGLSLPLIALQYHEVKLYFTFAASVAGINATFGGANLWVDYIYLDVDERRRFAQVSHEYLIEQVQFTGDETVAVGTSGQKTSNIRLNFNHPTKYLAWVVSGSLYGQYQGTVSAGPTSSTVASAGVNANGAISNDALAPLYSAKLQLNGQDRFSARWGLYFNKVQPLQTVGSKPAAGVYLYSFALKPQEHQPSGTCNFSRIDNATLNLTFKSASVALAGQTASVNVTNNATTVAGCTALTALRVFAVNYNILRILSGMGGLAYSN
jgi:hypothetical protein